jgi:hypothetical protein
LRRTFVLTTHRCATAIELPRDAANAMPGTTTSAERLTYAAPEHGRMIPISLPLPRRANLPATFGLKASFALFALLPLRVCRPATGLSVDRQQQLAIDPCVCPQPIIIMAAGEAGRVARSGVVALALE